MEEIKIEKPRTDWDDFVENFGKWNSYLSRNQNELIVGDETGELVVMSKQRYFDIYEKCLPKIEIVTYDDIAEKK